MKHPLGNHDTVEELGSLVQQAQQKAGTESKRVSGNCAESRSGEVLPRQTVDDVAF